MNSFLKKSLSAGVTIIAMSISAFADSYASAAPQICSRFESPKKFFERALSTMRAISPDPKTEMIISLSASPFGYPLFNGVDENVGVVVCSFFDEGNAPYIALACKATEDAAVSVSARSLKMESLREDGYFFLELSNPTQQKAKLKLYKDAIKAALQKPVCGAVKIDITGDFAANFLSAFFEAQVQAMPNGAEKESFKKTTKSLAQIFSEIDALSLSINDEKGSLSAKLTLEAKSGSTLSKFFEAMPLNMPIGEMKFIKSDAKDFYATSISPKSSKLLLELLTPLLSAKGISTQIFGAAIDTLKFTRGTSASATEFDESGIKSLQVYYFSGSENEFFSMNKKIYDDLNFPLCKIKIEEKKFGNIDGLSKASSEFKNKNVMIVNIETENAALKKTEKNSIYFAKEKDYAATASSADMLNEFFSRSKLPDSDKKLDCAAFYSITPSLLMNVIASVLGVPPSKAEDSAQPFVLKLDARGKSLEINLALPLKSAAQISNAISLAQAEADKQNAKTVGAQNELIEK